MQTSVHHWTPTTQWEPSLPSPGASFQLVLVFGPASFEDGLMARIGAHFADADVVYVSGGSQMMAEGTTELATEDGVVLAAMQFDEATIESHAVHNVTHGTTEVAAAQLASAFTTLVPGSHVLVFAEGIDVRGDVFLQAFQHQLPPGVSISGGLASNGLALTESVVGLNGPPHRRSAVAVAIHGPRLRIVSSVAKGWSPFGPTRRVTSAHDSLLARLDDEPALDVYRRYLGPFAEELPGSALLFPLAVRVPDSEHDVLRSILGVNDQEGTMAFAGDVPVNSTARLMRTSEDLLIDAVELATQSASNRMGDVPVSLALCVSCIGRSAVLRSRAEDEVISCRATPGIPRVIGFYSNGEFGPSAPVAANEPTTTERSNAFVMHNQSMTITLIGEA